MFASVLIAALAAPRTSILGSDGSFYQLACFVLGPAVLFIDGRLLGLLGRFRGLFNASKKPKTGVALP